MSGSLCPELLAPAGSMEALEAAVRCGADAVYLGASRFNARQHAANFSEEELCRAVAFCHGRGVKVYLTLNTLVKEDEMSAALAVAKEAAALGVDALILQDRGLARRIHAVAPTLPLHASTQLSCHTPAGVRALHRAGFSRVVLSREMSRAEIAACAGEGCELEVFVHGALCMCVSGQCYLSAMLGGRSGNRGLCAQPCRLPFAPAEQRGATGAALSLKDLSLLRYLPELTRDGVCSFKIEGRMKRPEYVAAAVSVCRAVMDGKPVDTALQEDLQRVFSRTGFTDGYYTGRRGEAMFGVRRREDVLAAGGVLGRLRELYRRELSRVPVTMALTVRAGVPVTLTVKDGVYREAVTGELPQPAIRQPLDKPAAEKQLQKTGGTPFVLQGLTCDIEAGQTVPFGVLSGLRRQALERLLALREAVRPHAFDETVPPAAIPPAGETLPVRERPLFVARVAHIDRCPADLSGADVWLIPADTPPEQTRRLPPGRWGAEIPRGLFGTEDTVRRQLAALKQAGAAYALCGNVGAIPLAVEAGLLPIGGFGLNITNREALNAYAAEGLAAATLSFELTFRQMGFAQNSPVPVGLFCYGRQPLMLTRNCPRQAAVGCRGCDGVGGSGLTDRQGRVFPTACAGGCTELLNSVVLDTAGCQKEWPPVDFCVFHFTDESPAEAAAVLARYRAGRAAKGETTRGLYRRGVE